MAQRRRTRIGKTGCLFWLFILLVIIVVFVYKGRGNLKESFKFAKNNPITEAFKKTDGETQKERKKSETIEKADPVQVESPDTESVPEKVIDKEPDQVEVISKAETSDTAVREKIETSKTETVKKPSEPAKTSIDEDKSGSAEKNNTKTKNEIKTKEYEALLYLVKIDEEDGTARPAPVQRTVKFKDSPITRTIEALLNGPTETEKRKGMTSFIPDDTELISASIKDGHLVLNFNEKFEENYSGREAILLELSQVLLTSFNINQVTKVSILIEGRNKRYITGEGIPLKDVYTKQDLSDLLSSN